MCFGVCLICLNSTHALTRSVFVDPAGRVLQWIGSHPGGRWSVSIGHRVCSYGPGHKAALRHSAGLEDMGQG